MSKKWGGVARAGSSPDGKTRARRILAGREKSRARKAPRSFFAFSLDAKRSDHSGARSDHSSFASQRLAPGRANPEIASARSAGRSEAPVFLSDVPVFASDGSVFCAEAPVFVPDNSEIDSVVPVVVSVSFRQFARRPCLRLR